LCDYSKAIPKCQCHDSEDPSPYCANSPRFSPISQLPSGPSVAPVSDSIHFGASPEQNQDRGVDGFIPTGSPTVRPKFVKTINPDENRDSGSISFDHTFLMIAMLALACSSIL
jgi:hypothetical protein